ncbi:hypothetical protein COJ60_27625 [Bacillus cereus]|nr:hypothetical protein CK938_05520 [Bacillus cereus]OUA62158.1 hypothetical protein BK786_27745 [Bacillus thuringiensis serovar thailandensis]PNS32099.1 hypothetical protein C1640_11605 [Bacillus sp. AKBS9]PEF55760.1 hypothetical protein CON32_23215 [Bacillus cereus]PFN30461.1 hypothetical protein COJ60_27625 [Bacillus cereus]
MYNEISDDMARKQTRESLSIVLDKTINTFIKMRNKRKDPLEFGSF